MLATLPYPDQQATWPNEGRHILAQHDDATIIVYQAFHPIAARYAAEHGHFGDGFSYGRMSWIKPNFLWMMYRSGWGTKANQERTLALRLSRRFFDNLLALAVPTTWDAREFETEAHWRSSLRSSTVHVQWDPDHHPSGARLERRAIQLGLRGDALLAYGRREILQVEDISPFVAEQRARMAQGGVRELVTPWERVYRPADPGVAARLGLAAEPR